MNANTNSNVHQLPTVQFYNKHNHTCHHLQSDMHTQPDTIALYPFNSYTLLLTM